MSEIVKSEYNALGEDNNYKTHYFKTSADQVVGLGRMKNTEYQVGDVVYSDTNNKVALKCTQAGTTSNTELDISGNNVGESVADGGVVWQVVSRDTVATIDQQRPIKTFTSLAELGLPDTCTPEDIALAMPVNSMLCMMYMGFGDTAQHPNIGLNCNAPLVVTKTGNMASFWVYENAITPNYATYAEWASTKFSGWKRVADRYALSMPSGNAITVSKPSVQSNLNSVQETNYFFTAPCDGWLYVWVGAGTGGNDHALRVIVDGFHYTVGTHWYSWGPYNTIVPMRKGSKVKFEVLNISDITVCNFIYAQSEG